jgi:hypothetical protein
MSGRDFAKFTGRPRDCRSPEALERRRRERSDYERRAAIVSLAPPAPKPAPPTEPAKPDFTITGTPDCGQWSSDGRYFLWQPPRPLKQEW